MVQWGGNALERRSHTSFFGTTPLVKMIDFLINRSFRSGQHGRADCLTP